MREFSRNLNLYTAAVVLALCSHNLTARKQDAAGSVYDDTSIASVGVSWVVSNAGCITPDSRAVSVAFEGEGDCCAKAAIERHSEAEAETGDRRGAFERDCEEGVPCVKNIFSIPFAGARGSCLCLWIRKQPQHKHVQSNSESSAVVDVESASSTPSGRVHTSRKCEKRDGIRRIPARVVWESYLCCAVVQQ